MDGQTYSESYGADVKWSYKEKESRKKERKSEIGKKEKKND